MATLYVAELNFIGGGGNHAVQGASVPPIVEQTLSISGGSVLSSAFNKNTTMIRVATDATCSVAFGVAPNATTSNMRLAAGQTEYFTVNPGSFIAVIQNT